MFHDRRLLEIAQHVEQPKPVQLERNWECHWVQHWQMYPPTPEQRESWRLNESD